MKLGLLRPLLGAIAVLLIACGSGQNDKARSTRSPEATSASTPNVAGTVISSFGKLEPFESFESAELRLGWRILRPSDARFHLVRQGGLLRTLPEVGLARVEQAYAMDGREGLVEIVQEPEAYEFRHAGSMKRVTIGTVEGELWGILPHGSFLFFSGEYVDDQRIRVDVYTNQSSDFTEEDFRAFVESLGFGDPTP